MEVPATNLVFTLSAPGVDDHFPEPTSANLVVGGFAPTLAQTASASIQVPSGNLLFSSTALQPRYVVEWTAPADNTRIICPTEITFELVTSTETGGRSIEGKKQYVQPDAGYWRIVYGGMRVRSNVDVLALRRMATDCEGRANPILIQVWDRKRAPIPPDGSPIVASANATAARGSATVVILMTNGAAPVAGNQFSVAQKFYRIRQVVSAVGNVYTCKVRPPLREAIPSGSSLEFDYPNMRVRLEKDDGLAAVLDLMMFATPTVAFVEDHL